MVLPIEARGGVVPPDTGYERHVKERSRDLARRGLGHARRRHRAVAAHPLRRVVRRGTHRGRARVRRVVHRRRRGPRRAARPHRASARSRAHCCTRRMSRWRSRPRALARSRPSQGVTRITAAIGTRAGSSAVLEASVRFARSAHAPLRLLSLVPIDLPSGMDEELADLASSRARRRGARRGAARAARRHRRDRARRRPARPSRSRCATSSGTPARSCSSGRAASPRPSRPVPRLDGREDAARAAGADDRRAAHHAPDVVARRTPTPGKRLQ